MCGAGGCAVATGGGRWRRRLEWRRELERDEGGLRWRQRWATGSGSAEKMTVLRDGSGMEGVGERDLRGSREEGGEGRDGGEGAYRECEEERWREMETGA